MNLIGKGGHADPVDLGESSDNSDDNIIEIIDVEAAAADAEMAKKLTRQKGYKVS